ncbi:uncharacterized protein LOC124173102 [Ischnura elegans]|uniref:uncharacterized protein LOC124173102 n=1 Tax=Ischnura elegans TaxID=197161 RepID=UPI001ED87550|nr:uncharacterized protein LOC124173102 [Ischnura elegans]
MEGLGGMLDLLILTIMFSICSHLSVKYFQVEFHVFFWSAVTKDGAKASRSATLKNMSQLTKDRVLFALSTVSSEPIVTTDVQSDAADIRDILQEMDDNRRIAVKEASTDFGGKLMSRVREHLKASNKRVGALQKGKDPQEVKRRAQSSLEKQQKEMVI